MSNARVLLVGAPLDQPILANVYVGPVGSNDNGGHEFAPYKTVSYAVTKLWATGGVINMAHNSYWTDGTEPAGAWGGKLTAGQGFRVSQNPFVRPGWWYVTANIIIRGLPQIQTVFGNRPKATMLGGDTDTGGPLKRRGDPCVWIDEIDGGITFEDIQFQQTDCPGRIGWDYTRDKSGNILSSTVSTIVRTGSAGAPATSATGVMTLTGIPTYNILGMSRASGVTHATLDLAAFQLAGINTSTSSIVRLVSSDGNFPSGDYTVAAEQSTYGVVSYVDPSAPATVTGGAVGTLSGHGAGARDRITLVNSSGSSHYPNGLRQATTLKVTASTYDTITFIDYYGGLGGYGGDGTFNNVGTVVTECRSLHGSGNLNWTNVGAIANPLDGCGPAFDVGKSIGFAFNLANFNGSSHAGIAGTYNLDEAAYILADGSAFGPTLEFSNGRTSNGNIRVWVSAGAGQSLRVNHFLQDSGTGSIPDAVELVNQAQSFVGVMVINLADVANADDGDADTSAIKLIPGLDPARVKIDDVPLFNGGIEGGAFSGINAYVRGTTGPTALGALTFDHGRVTAQHDTARRAAPFQKGGVVRNLLDIDLTNWTPSGVIAVTAGQPGPYGVNNAYKIVGTGSLSGKAYDGRALNRGVINYAVGDQFILAAWVRREDTGVDTAFNVLTMNGATMSAFSRSGEWIWASKVMTPPAPDLIDLALNGLGAATPAMWMCDPFLFFNPVASALDINELYEYALHLGPGDANLLPGTVGTARGQVWQLQGRSLGAKGVSVASANDITLGAGNSFLITGAVLINRIASAGWIAGSTVRLTFASNPAMANLVASGGGFVGISLQGGAFAPAAGAVLTLEFDGTVFQEVSRRTP